jgi:hypothetical protein
MRVCTPRKFAKHLGGISEWVVQNGGTVNKL